MADVLRVQRDASELIQSRESAATRTPEWLSRRRFQFRPIHSTLDVVFLPASGETVACSIAEPAFDTLVDGIWAGPYVEIPTLGSPDTETDFYTLPAIIANVLDEEWFLAGTLLEEKPCEALFDKLAENEPHRLGRIIRADLLKPSDLTFAAESMGKVCDTELVTQVLLPLLDHPSPLVREGAIYGLAEHLSKEVSSRLRDLEQSDPIPGVREAAQEILEA